MVPALSLVCELPQAGTASVLLTPNSSAWWHPGWTHFYICPIPVPGCSTAQVPKDTGTVDLSTFTPQTSWLTWSNVWICASADTGINLQGKIVTVVVTDKSEYYFSYFFRDGLYFTDKKKITWGSTEISRNLQAS